MQIGISTALQNAKGSNGAGLISPGDLANIRFWFDGNDTSTLLDASDVAVTDGVAIKTWANKVTGADFVQSTAGNRPTWNETSNFTSAAVRFDDSASQFMTMLSPPTINQAYTVFVVFSPITGGTAGNYVYNISASTLFYEGAANSYQLYGGAAVLGATTYALDSIATSCQVWNGTSSQAFKDGIQIGSDGNTGTQAFASMTLGAAAGGASPLNGEIAEVIILEEASSAGTVADVQAYLKATHGTP